MTKQRAGATWLVVLAIGVLGGCGGGMRAATANEIQCLPEDTDIINPEEKDGTETWIAQCRGVGPEYDCSRPAGSDRVSCGTRSTASDSPFEE